MIKNIKLGNFFISCICTVSLIFLLQIRIGDIPALGSFLNPIDGFWQNAESIRIEKSKIHEIQKLLAPVTVRLDENRIPHIFAKNEHDLYFMQGYMLAKDRLWEIDIQTRTAAGRLSEIIGPKGLQIDLYHRRIGMNLAALNGFEHMMQDPVIRNMLNAYGEGINYYISQLSPSDYPIEFKLLGYSPEKFKPINCVLFLKLMSETLSGGSRELAMTNNLKKLGLETVNDLFPEYPYDEIPVIPAGTKWTFKPLTIPKPVAPAFDDSMNVEMSSKPKGIGSNNWVVSGKKTQSGLPILANDPHLHLTFPSIWYQVQLSCPGLNADGVCFAGVPGIIIGFNNDISWGMTNVDADVFDLYQIKFKDHNKNEYWYDKHWNRITKHIEVIKVRGGETVIDTVLYTRHGPIIFADATKKPKDKYKYIPVGCAVKWIAYEASDEFKAFYLLNRSKNYNDYKQALRYYAAPAQNFIYADNQNNISMDVNGKFPLKYKNQGKFILDGSNPLDEWHGWIPNDQNPALKNPNCGFLCSANQSPTDTTYPYYLSWQFDSYDRAKRISDRLLNMNHANIDSMRYLQNDNYSILAQNTLGALISYIDEKKMTPYQRKVLFYVKSWNKNYDQNSIGASIFDKWWKNFYNLTWKDKFKKNMLPPSTDRTVKLIIKEPNSKWFDLKKTATIETCKDIVNLSFLATVSDLTKEKGTLGEKWEWGTVKHTFIDHLAHLSGLGTGDFSTGGNIDVVNALIDDRGPSWRMIVQMGEPVKGYGILPGGESGNPGSFFYDNMLDKWKQGKLDRILFLQNQSESSQKIVSDIFFKN